MVFSQQRALLKDVADFELIDAPYVCNEADEAKVYKIVQQIFPKTTYGPYREWINAREIEGDGAETTWKEPFVKYEHLEESLALIVSTLKKASPPFDGVMGFSQGGSLALLLLALQRAGRIDVPPLKFAWIQSARLPRDPSCAGLFDTPIITPCLVNYNEDDQSVAPDEVRQPPRIQPPEEGPTCLLLLGPT